MIPPTPDFTEMHVVSEIKYTCGQKYTIPKSAIVLFKELRKKST
jgi:hypothetical protein